MCRFLRCICLLSLVSTLTLTGCGAANFATSLRVVIAAGAPILDVLEQQHKISPELRAGLIADLSNEALVVGDMATCFKAIPSGDPASKVKHLQCVQVLDESPVTKKLLSDFGSNPVVANISDDISAVIQAAIIFYGGNQAVSARAAARSSQPVTEKEIKARIATLKRDLGQR